MLTQHRANVRPWMLQPDLEANAIPGGERPPSLAGKTVEALLYLSVLNSTFIHTTGAAAVAGLGGGVLMLAGLSALVIQLAQREPLPVSVWFAVVMNFGVNLTEAYGVGQMPVISEGVRPMLFWLMQMIMVCYLVRNTAAQKRMLVFFGIMLVIVIQISGVTARDERLILQQAGAGSSFGNSNQLSYMTGLFSIALLFWSLRARVVIRPLLWGLAAVLAYLMLKTGSRGGAVTYGCGLLMLLTTILLGRGVRLGGAVLVAAILAAVSQAWFLLADPFEVLSRRAERHSIRQDVYRWELLHDLWETSVFGVGIQSAFTSTAGIQAHNSFIYAHQAYGGITAWPYLVYLIVLAIRLARLMRNRDLPLDMRMMVATLFGMSLGAQALANHGYMFYSSIFALAVVDKYTSLYARRRSAGRLAAPVPVQVPLQPAWPTRPGPVHPRPRGTLIQAARPIPRCPAG